MFAIDNYDFKGKRAIIRVDFNVPLNEKGEVTDDTRIRAAIPTIKKVLEKDGSVILMSHLGRPKKNPDPKFSLEQIVPAIEKRLGVKVMFAGDCMGEKAAEMAKNLKPGEVMLLENLRFYAEEEGKPRGLAEDATDEEKKAAKKALKEGPQKEFVKKLASYADCYINDAFGTAHRAHASTALIADYFPNDKMFGYVMENELKAIDGIMLNPERPFCAILGGSKVSTKITIIENLLEKVDVLVLGGGMTYTFAAAEGGKVGNSICEPDQFQTALDILAKAKEKGVKVVMSPDALIADAFSADANTNVAPANNIPDGWEGVDIADEGKKVFREEILKCKTILWNGPVGVFEIDKFATGSRAVAEAIAEATSKGAYSLIGGGDSVACINKFGLADKVSYVSTGGGALLEYMEPSASSASELVTELIQYYGGDEEMNEIEASCLYAGIVVDTKSFTVQTSVRTFDAASYLRRCGANTQLVHGLFAEDIGFIQKKAQILAQMKIAHGCIAVAECPKDAEESQILAGQIADYLVTVKEIRASFVFYHSEKGLCISARSDGSINMQVIMEAVGGGGHQTVAGAQVGDEADQEAITKTLIQEAEKQIEEEKE